MDQRTRARVILLVEDNPAFARLVCEVFKDLQTAHELRLTRDGVEALDYLLRRDRFADAPPPDLILLDLNLPRLDGRELLARIKTEEGLKQIPVLVWSSSDTDGEVLRAYALHANAFLPKPGDLQEFRSLARAIEAFWLAEARLPRS